MVTFNQDILDNKTNKNTALEKVSCNLCGSEKNSLYFEKQGSVTDHIFQIVKCDECGLVFVNPRLNNDAIDALYDKEYFRGGGFDASVDYIEGVKQGVADTEIQALNRILSTIPRTSQVLEIGPGMGLLLKKMQDAGHDVQGLDISPFVVEELSNQGIDMLQGTLPHSSIASETYDAVIAIEVIEHVPDPMSFFKEVRRILKPGGMFYYETGNITCNEAVILGPKWEYIMPEGHLYYFSPKTLAEYCIRAGLSAEYPFWYESQRRAVKILQLSSMMGDTGFFDTDCRSTISRWLLKNLDRFSLREPFPMVKRERRARN